MRKPARILDKLDESAGVAHVESAQVVSEEELRATQEGYADPVQVGEAYNVALKQLKGMLVMQRTDR